MQLTTRRIVAGIAVPILLVQFAATGLGQEDRNAGEQATAAADIPAEIQDRGFDSYVDLELLRVALRELDAELVTDIALQLAEGERVLMRPHKAISTDELLGVAVRLGGQQQDTATLMRLSKAVKAIGRSQFEKQIADARKLAIQLRLDAPKTVEEAQERTKSLTVAGPLLQEVQRAGALGDAEWLHSLSIDVMEIRGLTASERKRLQTQIDRYISAIARADEPSTGAIARLAGFRRPARQPQP